jgi:Co/Zn/Cd efflux system component
VTEIVAEAVGQRLAGKQASRPRALLVSSVAAIAAGTLVYKLLRSGGDEESENEED